MKRDDRYYFWATVADLPALRRRGATIGPAADDGRFIVKLRAADASAFANLPETVVQIARSESDRSAHKLDSVRAVVEAATVRVRAEAEAAKGP